MSRNGAGPAKAMRSNGECDYVYDCLRRLAFLLGMEGFFGRMGRLCYYFAWALKVLSEWRHFVYADFICGFCDHWFVVSMSR